MIFDWDEDKRVRNIWKHGIDFIDITGVFFESTVCLDVSRINDLERRQKLIGMLGSRLISIVFTFRGDRIRLISARAASEAEQFLFKRARNDF